MLELSASGVYTFTPGFALQGSGKLAIPAGTATFATGGEVAISNLELSGGTLDGNDNVRVTNQLNWTGGAMNGSGKTVVDGQMQINGGAGGSSS